MLITDWSVSYWRMSMTEAPPRWRRRKTARPSEIVAAALEVFAEKGFAAARLDEIAARAGVSKGAVYLYFETKEELFREVVLQMAVPQLDAVLAMADAHPGPFADLAPRILARIAEIIRTTRLPSVLKMVVGESRNFPDLARVWHDAVVSKALSLMTGLITRAQQRGEVRPGDPRLHAVSLIGPMVVSILWREVFTPVGAQPLNEQALAAQHARNVLHGMLLRSEGAP
jgi:AcrR family transcriptional regulator